MYSYMPAFIVGVLAICVSGVTFVVQRHTQIIHRIKEKQKEMKSKQKAMSEIYKTKDIKDPAVKAEVDAMNKEIMSASMDMMKVNFKNMLWILLLSILVFTYIATFSTAAFPVGKFLGISAAFVWYILVSLVVNILLKLVFYILEKRNIILDHY